MIFDKAKNISEYFDDYPPLKEVELFIKRLDKEKLPDGSYELDGKRLTACIQSFRTKQQTDEMMFEAHKSHTDIMYIVSGQEKIRWAILSDTELVEERFSKGQDIAFYQGFSKLDFVLTKGDFIVFTPNDAHLPGLSVQKDINVRKIVFKLEV